MYRDCGDLLGNTNCLLSMFSHFCVFYNLNKILFFLARLHDVKYIVYANDILYNAL